MDILSRPPFPSDDEGRRRWCNDRIAEIVEKHKRAVEREIQPFVMVLSSLPPEPVVVRIDPYPIPDYLLERLSKD